MRVPFPASKLVLGGALALGLSTACTPPAADKGEEGKEEKAGDEKNADRGERKGMSRGTGPVAKVNGAEIERGGFDRQMDRTEARFERAGREISPALESRLKENLIRKLVDEELIRQKAKAEGLEVTKAELDAKFSEHKGRFGNDKAFASFLQRTHQTEADIRDDLEKNLLREKLFAKLSSSEQPKMEDAKAYFEKNKDKYKQREQVRASHVLFKVPKTASDEEKAKKKKKAQEVLAQAKSGKADFAALAKEHSEGPTAKRGGDLGKFSRGRMVKAFEEAAFSAKVGQVVGPVETQFGYHIIKVFEKVPERQREFEEVKDSILTSLKARAKSKATREVLAKLKESAEIEVLEPGVELRTRGRSPVRAEGGRVISPEALKKLKAQARQKAKSDK